MSWGRALLLSGASPLPGTELVREQMFCWRSGLCLPPIFSPAQCMGGDL